MIYKLSIKDPAKTPVPWLAKVDGFQHARAFEFKPGLNILWGRPLKFPGRLPRLRHPLKFLGRLPRRRELT